MRDQIVDFVSYWCRRTELPAKRLINWIGISLSKYFQWRDRYGRLNEHNAAVPRLHWLAEWEKQAIIKYAVDHPLDGYRRLSFMMLDENVVAVRAGERLSRPLERSPDWAARGCAVAQRARLRATAPAA